MIEKQSHQKAGDYICFPKGNIMYLFITILSGPRTSFRTYCTNVRRPSCQDRQDHKTQNRIN